MKEKDGHRILNNSFRNIGAFSYKLADIPGFQKNMRFIPKKPFDGFSVYQNNVYFWEMKILKPIRGFNVNELRDFQKESMEKINNNIISVTSIYIIIVLFLYELRKIKKFLFLNYSALLKKQKITKKEIIQLSQSCNVFDIKKGITDLKIINEKIIGVGL